LGLIQPEKVSLRKNWQKLSDWQHHISAIKLEQ